MMRVAEWFLPISDRRHAKFAISLAEFLGLPCIYKLDRYEQATYVYVSGTLAEAQLWNELFYKAIES